jgi:hypothetical protein
VANANPVERLLNLPREDRLKIYPSLNPQERYALKNLLENEISNPWLRFEDDPVGFVTLGLKENVWSKQREILESVRDNKRTAVPACHAPGKSHIAARIVAWWISVHPVGTAQVVTTATTFRQVRNILWQQIRKVHERHNLAGEVFTVEWKIDNNIVGYGFGGGTSDESVVQGIHAPHLLVIVDEAGGINETLGRSLEALMTGGHTRLLLLGNPPTDQEGSFFERACHSDLYNVIPISAYNTPNFTGEDAGFCSSCPPSVPQHPVTEHLVDKTWVDDVISEFGEDSAFVEARVFARFPTSTTNKVIPLSWAEMSMENEDVLGGEAISIGVDVASDGGDEFAIAWADGGRCSLRHNSSGAANANAVDVAGVVLGQIKSAEALHRERGVTSRVRVKIDVIGVGWGVRSVLDRWRDEGRHNAEIIPVSVGERAGDAAKFGNQRAEMWWNARSLLQPQRVDDGVRQEIRLDLDRKTLAQLSAPTYKSDSSGRIVIEKKLEMKRRGMTSPDRAEAVLLALYTPPKYRNSTPIAPLSFTQPNGWNL